MTEDSLLEEALSGFGQGAQGLFLRGAKEDHDIAYGCLKAVSDLIFLFKPLEETVERLTPQASAYCTQHL